MQRGRPSWLDGDIDRILVFRALQVGDLLCAIPALRALRATFPAARITLAGLRWAGQLTARFPHYLDDFLPFPGHRSLPEQPPDDVACAAFIEAVRARQFDLALQWHGSGELSNPIVRQFGARLTAGATRDPVRDGPGFIAYPESGHESERLLSLAVACGGEASDTTPEFPLLSSDWAELEGSGLPRALAGRPRVCLHAGARDPARRWPVECFAAVGDALAREGLAIVLTGSEAEHELAAAVAARMTVPAINAALPLSLGAMAALMQDASLVVCNDTGASHIAAGLRVPSVVVFTRDDPAHLSRWAPVDRARHRCVVDEAGTSVGAVLAEARHLLQESPIFPAQPGGE